MINPKPKSGDWVRGYSGPVFGWLEGELLERDPADRPSWFESLRVPGEHTPYLVQRSTVVPAERPDAAPAQRADSSEMTARQAAAHLRDVGRFITERLTNPSDPGQPIWQIAPVYLAGLAQEIEAAEQAPNVRYYRRESGAVGIWAYYRQRGAERLEIWHAPHSKWDAAATCDIEGLRKLRRGAVVIEEIAVDQLPEEVTR